MFYYSPIPNAYFADCTGIEKHSSPQAHSSQATSQAITPICSGQQTAEFSDEELISAVDKIESQAFEQIGAIKLSTSPSKNSTEAKNHSEEIKEVSAESVVSSRGTWISCVVRRHILQHLPVQFTGSVSPSPPQSSEIKTK